jgi:hypothetical protein
MPPLARSQRLVPLLHASAALAVLAPVHATQLDLPYPVGPTALGPAEVLSADLDGDGDLDALAASLQDKRLSWVFSYWNLACPPAAPASEVVRLGVPPNPAAFLPGVTSGPVLGGVWDPRLDHAAFAPGAVLDLAAISDAALNVPTAFGTLLCDPPRPSSWSPTPRLGHPSPCPCPTCAS